MAKLRPLLRLGFPKNCWSSDRIHNSLASKNTGFRNSVPSVKEKKGQELMDKITKKKTVRCKFKRLASIAPRQGAGVLRWLIHRNLLYDHFGQYNLISPDILFSSFVSSSTSSTPSFVHEVDVVSTYIVNGRSDNNHLLGITGDRELLLQDTRWTWNWM